MIRIRTMVKFATAVFIAVAITCVAEAKKRTTIKTKPAAKLETQTTSPPIFFWYSGVLEHGPEIAALWAAVGNTLTDDEKADILTYEPSLPRAPDDPDEASIWPVMVQPRDLRFFVDVAIVGGGAITLAGCLSVLIILGFGRGRTR